MNADVMDLTPDKEDPVLHAYLTALPSYSPRDGFQDRVMSRVWKPAPAWVKPFVVRARAFAHPRRIWMLAGGLAFTSSIFMAATVALAVANWMHVETAWRLFVGTVMLGAWSVVVQWTAASVAAVVRWFQLLDVGGSTIVVGLCAATLVVLSSAWGLLRTLKRYDSERVALNAMR